MRIIDIIDRKRRGEELPPDDISYAVRSYLRGETTDAQAAALLMAFAINGATRPETHSLTSELVRSGRSLPVRQDWVDKHSTGGVGDKITLVAGPIAAGAGTRVAKLSGRALGHTGGTLDKLASIPGLTTELSLERFIRQVGETGLAIAGGSSELVPADKKLYALRDHTATVSSLPLIAASVMSKKLVGGAAGIVLDVKAGGGAFCPTVDRARELAELMVDIGTLAGRGVVALISMMDQPLGLAVGNALEVAEAVDVLRGKGPSDVVELSLAVAAAMIVLGGVCHDSEAGMDLARESLMTGRAADKFRAMISAQGGDPSIVDDPSLLPRAPLVREVPSPASGWLSRIDARAVGEICLLLGTSAHPGVGLLFERKIGDRVRVGETVAKVHARTEDEADAACRGLSAAIGVSASMTSSSPPVVDRIEGK